MGEGIQILTDAERNNIRSDVYGRGVNEQTDFSDGKIAFVTSRCKGKAVLDLGCVDHNDQNATSRYWLHKAILGVAELVVGLDYYGPGVERLNAAGYKIVHGDAQSFDLAESFDVVVAGDLIEHLPNLDGLFSSVSRALGESGSFIVSTPNPWCWKYTAYHAAKGKLLPVNREHVSWFCLQTLENLGARYGFAVTSYAYCSRRRWERIVPLPSRIRHTTLCVQFDKIIKEI